MFYSKSTKGFYAEEIHGDNIPVDAVEITTEQHVQLLQEQSEGKQIIADKDGFPVAIFPDPPTLDAIIADKSVNGTSLLGTGNITAGSSTYNCLQFTNSQTYTPNASVKAFYVFVIGSTGSKVTNTYGGVGGPGYSETYVSSVSGSYTITIGAAGVSGAAGGTTSFVGSGVSISVTGSAGVNSTAPSSGGVATGGYFNANGGAGGSAYSYMAGGDGGSGSRAGVGGIGGNAPSSSLSGGGGGSGGNNASANTPGIAATSEAAGVLSLPFLSIINKFSAGTAISGAACVGYYLKCLATNTTSTFPSNYVKGNGTVYIVEVI